MKARCAFDISVSSELCLIQNTTTNVASSLLYRQLCWPLVVRQTRQCVLLVSKHLGPCSNANKAVCATGQHISKNIFQCTGSRALILVNIPICARAAASAAMATTCDFQVTNHRCQNHHRIH